MRRTISGRRSMGPQMVVAGPATSGNDLVTREWTCTIPGEQTSLLATANTNRITLTGTLGGKRVSRSYPLRGQTWMQLLLFDPATFVTSNEQSLTFVSIGTSGRGALQLTDFELTKKGSGTAVGRGRYVEAELVMPRWRRFWGAVIRYHADTGDLLHQHIRGKKQQVLEPRGARTSVSGPGP